MFLYVNLRLVRIAKNIKKVNTLGTWKRLVLRKSKQFQYKMLAVEFLYLSTLYVLSVELQKKLLKLHAIQNTAIKAIMW